jgi:acetoin utilization protein AcuB
MHVADWMTKNVPSATPTMGVADARRLAETAEAQDIRWLPVSDGERIVGLVALSDLEGTGVVGDRMRSPVPTIAAAKPVEEAGLLLLGYELEALPVLEPDGTVGLITKTDVLHALLQLRGRGPLDIAAAVIQAEEGEK